MPDLTLPDWGDKKEMSIWVNAMLDAELEAGIAAANSAAAIEETLWLIEPVDSLLDSLSNGTASPLRQWRAAQLIEATKAHGRPGRKRKSKMDRDALLTMTAQDARRIMELWRQHYDKPDLPRAISIACERWVERHAFKSDKDYECAVANLTDRVFETLRRPKGRNFGAQ